MKKMQKILTKIGLYVATPTVVLGTTLGVTLGVKTNKNNGKTAPKATNDGERYFDSILVKSQSALRNNVLFPAGGENLLLDFIPYYKKRMGTDEMKSMIKTPLVNKETKKIAKGFSIDFKTLNHYSDVKAKFLETNKAINDWKQKPENINKRFSIWWTALPYDRLVKIEIYELATDAQDQKVIQDYIDALETKKTLPVSVNPDGTDFVDIIAGELRIANNDLLGNHWFRNLKNIPAGNALSEKRFAVTNGEIDSGDANHTKIKIRPVDHGAIDENIELIKNHILVTLTPTIDFQDSNPSKIKYLFTFYKIDPQKSIIDLSHKTDYVSNPKNIYQKVIERDLSDIFGKVADNATMSASVDKTAISSIKDEKQQLYSNKELMFYRLTKSWLSFMDLPLAKPGLQMMGSLVPSVASYTSNFIETMNVLKKLSFKNVNYQGKNQNALNVIFKEKEQGENDDVLDRLFDKMNNSTYIQPTLFWSEAIKNFTGDKDSKWAQIDSFTSADNNLKNGESISSVRALYHFIAGFRLFDPVIRKRIVQLYKNGILTENPYQNFDNNRLIDELLNKLKKAKIIEDTVGVAEIISKPKVYVEKLLDGLNQGHNINLESKYFDIIFSIIGLNISEEQEKHFSNILGHFFSKDKNLSRMGKLIVGDNTAKAATASIFDDPISLVSIIGNNASSHKGFLKDLGCLLFDKNVISDILKIVVKKDIDFSTIAKGLKYGFDSPEQIENWIKNNFSLPSLVSGVLPQLVSDIYKGKNDSILWPILVGFDLTNIKDLSQIFKNGLHNSSSKEITAFVDSLNKLRTIIGPLLINLKVSGAESILNKISEIFDKLIPGSIDDTLAPFGEDKSDVKDLIKDDTAASRLSDASVATKADWDAAVDAASTKLSDLKTFVAKYNTLKAPKWSNNKIAAPGNASSKALASLLKAITE